MVLNIFGQIERLLTKDTKSVLTLNLTGLYGYVFGTVIYFFIGYFIFELAPRVYCLAIPIIFTVIGFNISKVQDDKKLTRKKLLLTINIVLLLFWFATTFYFYQDLKYKKESFDQAKQYFKELDNNYLRHGDSLKSLFNEKRINSHLFDKLENDTLESLVVEQMKLFQEFSKYRESNDYVTQSQFDYIWNYSDMTFMLIVGFVLVAMLNGVYITYFIIDMKATTANNELC